MKPNNNLKSLDQFVDEQYGEVGTSKRDAFEKGYEAFKLGFLLQQARLEKGLTQEELAKYVEPIKVTSLKSRTISKKCEFQHFRK